MRKGIGLMNAKVTVSQRPPSTWMGDDA